MKLEQALKEYKRKKKEEEKRIQKLKDKHNKRIKKKIQNILKKIEGLERKRLPKDIDERIARLVENDRKNYVRALKHALRSVEDIDDLGKRLPDMAKLHVGHGKYLLIAFEKDIYTINRLLKELSEEYEEYYREVSIESLGEFEPEKILEEERRIHELLKKVREDRDKLRKVAEKKRAELQGFYHDKGLDKLEGEIKSLNADVRRLELEVRSKASKLQRPIKRMRLGGFADEFLRDTGAVIENPGEFIALIRKIRDDLNEKHRKTADWLIKHLPEKATEIKRRRKELEKLQERKDEVLEEGATREKEIWKLEREVEEKEAEIRKLRHQLEHLEAQLNEALSKLGRILGEEIER